ncbi:tripartite tricarboxylate transporter substrate-binding protein [Variovorax sp.]|uniref:tripartite tricarboxylate transporter substrate-binding protein n=1 Tax=Variovorax sp. TaxID=1871043 RepID=UPI002D5CA4E1|nr:tripartite tricarboxylate transporter substrate-binding protein [Variovorax sp.]HYP82713.1 tripartite tricarboxylate transporter substrate-binding protein [Variovorax sp.]
MTESTIISRRGALRALAATVAGSACGLSFGQSGKPVTLVVPVPPGGGMDSTARLVAEQLRPSLGTIIVDNRPGAALRIALNLVKRSAPDGHTLLFTSISPFTIYPFVYTKLDYKVEGDLLPVAPVVSYEFAIAVPGDSPIKSLAQYIAAVKKDPDVYGLYAVPAAGAAPHFAGAALATAAGIPLKHVPYKGSAPAMQDLIGGHVPACVNVLGEFLPYRESGKVRVLATTGAKRSELMPDVPTLVELGYKGLIASEQFGLFAPAGTSPELVNRINASVRDAMQKPDVRKRLAELGYVPAQASPSEFAASLRSAREFWKPVVMSTGFTLDE